MWLLYKLIEKTDEFYKYAYSRETKDLDGVIVYDRAKKLRTLKNRAKAMRETSFLSIMQREVSAL